jgi:hypothetical protein
VKQSRKVVTTDAEVGFVRRKDVNANRKAEKGSRRGC